MTIRTMISMLAITATFAAAQDITPATGAGVKALLFTFDGLDDLGADEYKGGIGAKFYLTGPMALRGSLIFGYSTTNIPVPGGATGTDGSSSRLEYGVNTGVEFHLLPGRVSPYVGGAVSFTSTNTKYKNYIIPPGVEDTDINGGRAGVGSMDLGAGGLTGVEFFLTKEISLSAEYMLGYNLTSRYDFESIQGATTTKTKYGATNAVNISNSGALTLAVHF